MSNEIKHTIAKKIEELICKKLNGGNNITHFLKKKNGKNIKVKCKLNPDRYGYYDIRNKKEKIIYEVKYLNPKWHKLQTIHLLPVRKDILYLRMLANNLLEELNFQNYYIYQVVQMLHP